MSEYITPQSEEPKLNNAAPLINNYPINNNENCTSDSNCKTNDNENCYPEYKTNENINCYPDYKTNDNENYYTDCKTEEYNKKKELLKDKIKISSNCKLILLIISYLFLPLMKLVFLFLIEIYTISQSIVFICHFIIGILLYYLIKNNQSMALMIIISVSMFVLYYIDIITFFIYISMNYGLLNCFVSLFFDLYGYYVLVSIQDNK